MSTPIHEQHDVTRAEVEEKAKLQKHFGRFDILFFLICTLVGVDTIGTVASSGAEAFTWMAILAVIFFIPSALLFAELGSAFPEEGGPYVWARLAFGRLAGAINNFLYWITNPVWLGGSLATLAAFTFGKFFLHQDQGLDGAAWYVFTLIFVWVGVLAAILSFQVGKWIPTIGAWARFVLLGGFTIAVILYAIQNGIHGFGFGDFGVTYPGFIGLVGVLMFNFVGFELPSSAGDEMTDPQKDVPFGIFRAAIAAIFLYGLPILGILLVLPTDQVTSLGGFVDAIQSVFTVFGGSVSTSADGALVVELTGMGMILGDFAALLFIICLLTSGVTWIMGSDRALAVSAFDGAGPRSLGVISAKFGTPVRVNILSGVIATIVLLATRYFVGDNTSRAFTAVLGLAISTTLISYLLIFPALAVLRRRLPKVDRPYKAPWPTFISALLTILILFASIQLFLPGLGVDWFGDDYRPDGWEAGEGMTFLVTNLVPLILFILLGVIFYALGAKTRRDVVVPGDEHVPV